MDRISLACSAAPLPSIIHAPWRRRLLLLLMLISLFVHTASAQSVSQFNQTTIPGSNGDVEPVQIAIATGPNGQILNVFSVVCLTSLNPPRQALSGTILLANASTQLAIADRDIAFISCDPYTGNIQPTDVFGTAENHNATAIVFYSEQAPSCVISSNSDTYRRIYTLTNQSDTEEMLHNIGSMGSTGFAAIAARQVLPANGTLGDGSGADNGNGNASSPNTNPLGPSPSTAVAMIILYSITGIITALFLIIIITGAVRAHRHPERYGPRNGIGRPRQSRARGLARAMLETIPIVKFGDRLEEQRKPTDVELAGHGEVEILPEQPNVAGKHSEAQPQHQQTSAMTQEPPQEASKAIQTGESDEGAIAAAISTDQPRTSGEETRQGCSICTEDFQVGEDQRVLPCDHRFHPACIDPWLLNVSGTCPLCRIDLRPQARTSTDGTSDGHELADGFDGLAPPLAEPEDVGSRRTSTRRSILQGVIGRPERMTREERVGALRRWREYGQNEQQEERHEEESSVRRRLRKAFRVRTRRIGEETSPPPAPRRQGGAAAEHVDGEHAAQQE